VPALLLWLKQRRRYSVAAERRALVKQLSRNGASDKYVDVFRRELLGIETMLRSDGLAEFLRHHRDCAEAPGE
jgi:hypothetical protein